MERKEEIKVSDDKKSPAYNHTEIHHKIEASPKAPGIKAAFRFNHASSPWVRGISSGLSSSLPILIGILFDHLQYGLIASIGGFTYLYTKDEPYAQRAVKLFLALLGITLCFTLGSLFADVAWMKTILFGVIGAVSVYVFGALKIPGPSAMFFVLSFAVSTSIPAPNLQAVFLHAGLVFLGGALSWCISMSGWLINPRGPETAAVAKAYRQLASFVGSLGTKSFHAEQHKTVVELRAAETAMKQAKINRKKSSFAHRLFLLNQKAEGLFIFVMAAANDFNPAVSKKAQAVIETFASEMATLKKHKKIRDVREEIEELSIKEELRTLLLDVNAVLQMKELKETEYIQFSQGSVKTRLKAAFHKRSYVLKNALRYGIIMIVAAAVAYTTNIPRSYWIPLTCAGVMLGATVRATVQRGIQRSVGTILGILIGTGILMLEPTGIVIALIVFVLQSTIEIVIVKNYALGTLFITPNALLIAESGHPDKAISYFTSARVIDIVIGSIIGVVGTVLVFKRASSLRLPYLLGDVIRKEGQFLEMLSTEQDEEKIKRERNKLQGELVNLRALYDNVIGEYSKTAVKLEGLWPAVVATQQLGYMLLASFEGYELSETEKRELKETFAQLAAAAEQKRAPKLSNVPTLKHYPIIQGEITALYESLQVEI